MSAPRTIVGPLCLALVSALIAGCGGGSSRPSRTSSTVTTSSTATGSSTPVAKSSTTAKPPTRRLSAEVITPGVGSAFGPSATVEAGHPVDIRVTLPSTLGTRDAKVTVHIAQGPAKTLRITAKSEGQTSSATIKAAGGSISLPEIHYTCELPPVPTPCPLRQVRSISGGVSVRTAASARTPLVFAAVAGPLPTPLPKARKPGSAVVPAYHVTESVRVVSTKPGSTPASVTYGPSAMASAGQLAVFKTTVAGALAGAPQALSLTVNQGPAASVNVTAQISGGPKSMATVSAAHGRLALVLPRFACALPPFPTFCPAQRITAGFHRYTLTFPVSPVTPPIAIVALASAG